MGESEQIQIVLEGVSFLALGLLIVFQYAHYVVAAWRYWSNHKNKLFYVGIVGVGWALFIAINLTVIPSMSSYVDGLPYTILALYFPAILALLALAFSRNFRNFADSLSLRWLIIGFAGPARMIVGIIFLFWYFAGRLPAVVAWIAGPGDWIAGFVTYVAVDKLQPIAKAAKITKRHWSVSDYVQSNAVDSKSRAELRKGLAIAAGLVMFGIADFIAAPASTAISIAMGNIPEEMGNFPLAVIPLVLVPQVLVLEVLALRQFYVLNRCLRDE